MTTASRLPDLAAPDNLALAVGGPAGIPSCPAAIPSGASDVTGFCRQRRSLMTAAICAMSGLLAASGALALSGCAPDLVRITPARAADTNPASVAPETPCSGAGAEPLLAAFFRDIDAGKSDLVPRYFAPAHAFVRWSDPKSGPIGGRPGDGAAALDQLREHLFGLEVDGFVESMTSFHDKGYLDQGTANAGGWFGFELSGSPASGIEIRAGHGDGAIDCASGRIKILTIDQW